jgi:hypothetical protein
MPVLNGDVEAFKISGLHDRLNKKGELLSRWIGHYSKRLDEADTDKRP